MVHVTDANRGEGLGQLRLRQSGLAAQRGKAHIDEDPRILLHELRNEVAGGLAFVSDAPHSPRSGGVHGGGIRGAHGPYGAAPPVAVCG